MVSQVQSLHLKQSQNLVMSQQMQQSLKILQLSTMDLVQLCEAELEKNPLLEMEAEQVDPENQNTAEAQRDEDDNNQYLEKDKASFDVATDNEIHNKNKENVLDGDLNSSWNASDENTYEKDYQDNDNYNDFSRKSADADDAGTIIEKTLSKEVSLKDHLLEQVNLDFLNPKNKIIAAHLIDMIDASGYLSSATLADDIKNLAKQLGCKIEDIENVIARLQKCDPLGVCSRSLKECLKIQLNERKTMDTAIEKLVDNLELLANGELDKLRKLCNVDMDDLKEMIKEIKSLNPRPASEFSEDKVQTKHADLIIEKKNGDWDIDLNYDLMPRISVRKDYYDKIKANKLKGNDKKYISENYSTANFLVRAIEQRAESMLKIGMAIMEHQKQFLEKGINFLKPISMKGIAEEVGLHESTVGRVVANKYIATPSGVYEMRYFFTSGLSGTNSEDEVSSETAKHQIKQIIENEEKVYSDDDIAAMLKKQGIDIARRTVAKYRENMNIPTSAVRKRLKKIKM